jgi:phosphatidylglycerol---prolipoprotein diacylglyceryl transferase
MPLASIPSPPHAVWHFGPVPVRLQALFAVAGIVLALVIAERRYRAAGGRPGAVLDVAVWAVPAGLIPAVLGTVLATASGTPWQQVRTWDDALGYPGAAALGTLAAWVACRRARRRRLPPSPAPKIPAPKTPAPKTPNATASASAPDGKPPSRMRLAPLAGAVAPALAFGLAVADLGGWAAQQGYGHPSSLWWAVQISPAHRLSGYENFATFQPMFLYEALWGVATGVTVIWATRRFALRGDRSFALAAAGYAAGGFALFWLGIGHLPVVLGIRAGELGDAIVLVGSVTYLARTRPRRRPPFPASQKVPLERDSPVM